MGNDPIAGVALKGTYVGHADTSSAQLNGLFCLLEK